MSKRRKKSKLQKAQDRAKHFYFSQWRESEKICPAFGEVVYVSRLGWNHLVNPPKRRTKVEKIARFRVLSLARKLLETATTYQEHRVKRDIHYFSLEAVMGGTRIRVVVSSKGAKGTKRFYSVMILK